MRMMLMLLMLMECGYDESGYQSVVILQVLIWLIGSILDGPVQGMFPPDHGVSVDVMREVAVLAFKAVTR